MCRQVFRVLILLGTIGTSLLAGSDVSAAAPDPLGVARRLYNLGQYDRALEAAREAAANPATAASARLVIGRINLERYRQSYQTADLDEAHAVLKAIDPQTLDARERVELQVGLAELLYFDEQFRCRRGTLRSGAGCILGARRRRPTGGCSTGGRPHSIARRSRRRIASPRTNGSSSRMEQELRHDPSSGPAAYWLAAASRGAGDLDRAWAAASAGWIRAGAGQRWRGRATRRPGPARHAGDHSRPRRKKSRRAIAGRRPPP